MFVRLAPVILSALLLAAHFSRHDTPLLVVLSVLFPLVLLIRRTWAARLVQAVLVLGALEWLRTLVVLTRARQAAGEDWVRMALILAIVAAVTLASALVFGIPKVRERYALASNPQGR
jgi:hypothetical protein